MCRAAFSLIVLSSLIALSACTRLPSSWLCKEVAPCLAVHKGDIAFAPGNSLVGIKHALKNKADFIEIDVRASLDGELFLFHDSHIHEGNYIGMQSLSGKKIKQLKALEIERLKIPSSPPSSIPKLEHVLELLSSTQSHLLLDVKDASPSVLEQIASLVRKSSVRRRVFIQVYDPSVLKFLRETFPDLKVLARSHNASDLDLLLSFKPEIVQVDASVLEASISRKIHSFGASVLVKTVDDNDTPSHWRALKEAGADIILTDFLDKFSRARAEP